MFLKISETVQINDVVLRDGLQLEQKVLSVDEKLMIAESLIKANVRMMEVGSFVHPTLVPQMANTGDVIVELKRLESVEFIALIPNLRGADRARQYDVGHLNFVFSASNTHNQQNVRQTTEDSLNDFYSIKSFCDKHSIKLDVAIATSFGCPFEGEVPEKNLFSIIEKLLKSTPNTITLADTTGMANPKQVYHLVKKLRDTYPFVPFRLHFRDTRGMGLTNIIAGLEAGVRSFDTALGGLGGCPFAPGATGNVSTEDVVHMLHAMGMNTGIDLDILLEASKQLQHFIGHELSSRVAKAGRYDRKYPIPV